MIPEWQYLLRIAIRGLTIALTSLAIIVLAGLLGGWNVWAWIVAYWGVLTLKNLLECFKW